MYNWCLQIFCIILITFTNEKGCNSEGKKIGPINKTNKIIVKENEDPQAVR